MTTASLLALLALAATSSGAKDRFLLVVDPGHGGEAKGARGPSKVWEKEVCLAVAKRFAELAHAELGAEVLLTREGDDSVPLSDRPVVANQSSADVFVSIHANSMPTSQARRHANGIETYFLSAESSGKEAEAVASRENAEQELEGAAQHKDDLSLILDDLARSEAHADSSRLAYAVQGRLVKTLLAVDRGVQQAPFVVLMGAQMPAVLVEIGFISHPVEGRKLADPAYEEQIARALVAGIADFRAQVARRDLPRAELRESRGKVTVRAP